MNDIINIKNLKFSYKKEENILNIVNLEVCEGDKLFYMDQAVVVKQLF